MVISLPINAQEKNICFSEKDAGRIIVDLENAQRYKAEVEALKESNLELDKQIEAQKKIVKLKEDELKIVQASVDEYKKLLDTQKEAYEKQLKEQKPSIFREIFVAIGSLGIGVLLGLLL